MWLITGYIAGCIVAAVALYLIYYITWDDTAQPKWFNIAFCIVLWPLAVLFLLGYFAIDWMMGK